MRAYDEVRTILAAGDKKFSALIDAGSGGRAPRYFHGVFLAVYELLFKDGVRVKDYAKANLGLIGIGTSALTVPGGGGDWTGAAKRRAIDAVKGVLLSSFEKPLAGADDLANFGYASQLETILGNALIEQQLFDCKQGFIDLSTTRTFDEASLKKITRTMSAMANGGKGISGYVAVGIADTDTDADARRVASMDGVTPMLHRGFRIVGIEREAKLRSESLNDYWHWVIQKLLTSELDSSLAQQVASTARLIPYQGLAVGLLRVQAGAGPTFFEQQLYERIGSDTKLVELKDYQRIFSAFA